MAEPYNAFVFDDFTSGTSDVEGRVATGGNLLVWSYSIGLLDPGQSVIDGDGWLTDATLHGDVAHGGSLSLVRASISGSSTTSTPIAFATARADLENLSARLAAESANGTTTLVAGELRLVGTNGGRNVFSASTAQISAAWGITVAVPTGSTAIVNVSGATVDSSAAAYDVGSARPEEVLFNLHEATSLRLQGVGVQGTILAPWASVDFDNGQLNGQLIAAAFDGDGMDDRQTDGQLNLHPFEGDLCP